MKRMLTLSLALLVALVLEAQPWIPDLGNGKFKNPIINADYSDPDVIRVGSDYYMVSSSFNCMPGIPILHSNDLVNWTIINHVYQKLPLQKYDKPAHGQGAWAPTIRYHDGKFYVFFCTPYDGLFMAVTDRPEHEWKLTHVVNVEYWEDPCPFWDEDGNAYLVRGKLCGNDLYLHKMSPDGTRLLDDGKLIFSDKKNQPVIEGPKLYKKDGYYYIFAPAGGVKEGWQAVLRSKNIYGPYEAKKVMHQGNTTINGPHQGGLINTPTGEWWFLHFQDMGYLGRVVHLNPVEWKEGWPVIGQDPDNDGIGEPVSSFAKPNVGGEWPLSIPQTSDEFNSNRLGLQWQWHANPQNTWYDISENQGVLRLRAVQNLTQNGNLWMVPNLLLQKFPAPEFTVTTKLEFYGDTEGDKAGLVIMGRRWAYLVMEQRNEGKYLVMYEGNNNKCESKTREVEGIPVTNDAAVFLRVRVLQGKCRFEYSFDNQFYSGIGTEFTAQPGQWIGAKVGLFCLNPTMKFSNGYANVDWFRVE